MKGVLVAVSLIICCLGIPLSYSAEKTLCQDVLSCYLGGEYRTAADLLKRRIERGLNTKQETNDKLSFGFADDQYAAQLFLAHLYAWRLNDTTEALRILMQTRSSKSEAWKQVQPVELLYSAEIHEKRGNKREAEAAYKQFLDELADLQEKQKRYDEGTMFSEEFARIAKYQLDGMGVASGKAGKYLKRVKVSSLRSPIIAQYLTMAATPFPIQIKLLSSGEPHYELTAAIKQCPHDLGSMILYYAAIVGSIKKSVNDVSERELKAYLDKFTEDYYALFLRASFIKIYRDKGDVQKAEKLEQELKAIAEKRGIEIIVGMDNQFSSPEASWETYKDALKRGDIEDIVECSYKVRVMSRAELKKIDIEMLKKMGENFRKIEKVSIDGNRAKYRRHSIKDGKDVVGTEYFTNVDGEWKVGGLAY